MKSLTRFAGLLCLLCLPGACAVGTRDATRFEIPFVKFTLDNGLDVVLHQDRSDPIVAIATLIHVGSSREKPGKTGFAHFFEHMSFNDSENVPRGANRKMINELGGTRNGGTWQDGTIYYEVVPKDAFEKLLWIDSDRLGFMINTVTEWALENEKQVVKNERRQRVDNRPYGHSREIVPRYLYPEGHPYSWPVIGSLEDLQAATLDDVRDFYDRFYGANNATLVIAGDIDLDHAQALVAKWFGEIRRAPEIDPLPPMPVSLNETRSVYHEDNFATLPELRMVFPAVEAYHEDSYALEALAEILADGKRAPLYNVIVEERQLAPGVSASNDSGELAGSFTIRVRAKAGIDLDEVRVAIEQALARFEERGFLDKDLEHIKSELETDFYNDISSVLDKAFQLASYNEFAGDPGYVSEDLARIQSVTRDDVIDAYRRYIKGKHFVMTSFVPRGEAELAIEGAMKAEIHEERIVPGAEKHLAADPDFVYEKTPTSFERTEPALGPPPVLNPPEVWTATASNGLQLMGTEHSELPLVEFRILIEGGHRLDPPDKAGAARLLANLMNEGTRTKTPEQLEDAIGELGADIDVSADREGILIEANGLSRHYRAMLELVAEILLEPRWDAKEFERLKSAQLTGIRQREGDPRGIAARVFDKLIYGDEHIYALPGSGTLETVSRLTLEDLRSYYESNVSPSVAALLIAGDVTRDDVLASLSDLEQRWKPKDVEFPTYPIPEPPPRPRVYFVDAPGSKQSVIQVGRATLGGDDEDYNDLVYANTRLGDGSSSRLFQLLRIEKGYTYGAGSRIPRRSEVAPFVVSSSVRANVTLESLELIEEQLRRYGPTFTEQDLETTKNLLVKEATRQFETLDRRLEMLEDIARFNLPLDFVKRDQQELAGLTLGEIRATIERHLDPSRMLYLVVGDGATQRERVAQLGYGEPIELDAHGNPVRPASEASGGDS